MRYRSPCLEEIAPGKFRCKNRGLIFESDSENVRCCSDNQASQLLRDRGNPLRQRPAVSYGAGDSLDNRTAVAASPSQLFRLCGDCLHLINGSECEKYRGCDGQRARIAAIRRGFCAFRIAKPAGPAILGRLSRDTFITTDRLIRDGLELARQIVADRFDWVAGVARSGLMPAAAIATELNLRLAVCYPGGSVEPLVGGFRTGFTATDLKGVGLIVDDTSCSGQTFALIRKQCQVQGLKAVLAAVYSSPKALAQLDAAGYEYDEPHFLEWNFTNNVFSSSYAYDFDGILCEDPRCHDTEPEYEDHIVNAKPLYPPRSHPIAIITSRTEKWREQSRQWLQKHGIRFFKMVMWTDEPQLRFSRHDTIAKWKAEQLQKLAAECQLKGYIESDPATARGITRHAGLPVVCPAAQRVFGLT